MKSIRIVMRSVPCFVLILMILPVCAEDNPPPAQPDSTNQPPKAANPNIIVYIPPRRGMPATRPGGGTRGISQLSVLVPSHTAVSTLVQPRLYWYQSPGFRNTIRFRLARAGAQRPVLEIVLSPQPNGGIQYLDLADHDVSLEPGKLYEWGVMLEPQPHQRWPALISSGRIVVDEPDAALTRASQEVRPYLAARRGYWYDALYGISRLLDEYPGNPKWRLQRAELLEQVGLGNAASYDRQMASSGR